MFIYVCERNARDFNNSGLFLVRMSTQRSTFCFNKIPVRLWMFLRKQATIPRLQLAKQNKTELY